MDRVIVYPGSIPLDTDFLSAQRHAQQGIAKAAETILGTDTLVDGFDCIPTTPASLSVQVLKGVIHALSALDASAYGTLAANITDQLVKQGVVLDTTTLTTVAPATSGHAVNYLVQVGFVEADEVPIVLPYYNATDPSQPYSGPGNSGGAQYTKRRCKAVLSLKAGTSATSGSQVTPTPDPGYVPLWVVTVAQGATTLSSGNIAQHPDAPFLIAKLPVIPYGIQDGRWIYCVDTGSANSIEVSPFPLPDTLVAGMSLRIKVAATATAAVAITVDGQSAIPLRRADGTQVGAGGVLIGQVVDVVFDGTSFQLTNSSAAFDLDSVGGGVDIYEGASGGVHSIRSLLAGSNITLTLVEDPPASGHYAISIAATGGGGGGGVPLENVGDGQSVYKGFDGTNDELRTIKGVSGITSVTNSDVIEVKPSDVLAYSVLVRNAGSDGIWTGVPIISLTEETAPGANDMLMLGKTSTGALRSVRVSNLRGGTGIGSTRAVRLGGNRTDGTNVTAYMTAPPTGTWTLRGDCWQAQYGATGAGEPLFDWYGLVERTA